MRMARRSRRIHHHHRQRKDRCSPCLIKTGSDSAGFETKSICKVLDTDTSFGSEEVVVSPGSKRRDTQRVRYMSFSCVPIHDDWESWILWWSQDPLVLLVEKGLPPRGSQFVILTCSHHADWVCSHIRHMLEQLLNLKPFCCFL
jgi:hypothetical protein